MTIFEIDNAILQLIDPETGELLDYDAFASLSMERDTKIENMALWVKELKAEACAIASEIASMKKRKESAEKKADRLEKYLAEILGGNKWSSPKAAVTFRNTNSVDVDDGFVAWALLNNDDLLSYKEPEPSKTKIKAYLAEHECAYARMVTKQSITVK